MNSNIYKLIVIIIVKLFIHQVSVSQFLISKDWKMAVELQLLNALQDGVTVRNVIVRTLGCLDPFVIADEAVFGLFGLQTFRFEKQRSKVARVGVLVFAFPCCR
jgi:hypothetical protein